MIFGIGAIFHILYGIKKLIADRTHQFSAYVAEWGIVQRSVRNGARAICDVLSEIEQLITRSYRYGLTSYDAIAQRLHVGKARVSAWLSRTVKEERDHRNAKIQALWLACHTQEEIAEVCGLDLAT